MTTQTPPAPPDSPKLDIGGVYKHSPIGFVGVLMIGLANAPHWSLTPVYTSDLGMTVSQVGTFATFLTLGAALFQIPVGRLSDSFDRRKVLVGLLVVSALIEIGVAIFGTGLPFQAHYAIAFLLGGTVATQYYVTAAHTNDRTAATQAVQISSTLLLLFCIGAIIGPITASESDAFCRPFGLFWHNAVVHSALALFVLYRISLRARHCLPRRRPIFLIGRCHRTPQSALRDSASCGRATPIRCARRIRCSSSVVEHFIGNEEVGGSIPPCSTSYTSRSAPNHPGAPSQPGPDSRARSLYPCSCGQ